MKSPIGAPTKAHQRRFQMMQHFGCIASYIEGRSGEPGDIHHLLSGGERIGHEATICLAPWFHRGNPPGGMTIAQAKAMFGPSMKHHPREFRARYGTDAELLKLQNELLAEAEKTVISRIGG